MTFIAVSLFCLCLIQAWCIRLLERRIDYWRAESFKALDRCDEAIKLAGDGELDRRRLFKESLNLAGEVVMRRRWFLATRQAGRN